MSRLYLSLIILFFSTLHGDTITHNGTTYGMVTSPYTGKVWLDRNLGASQVCTASNDTACYGDYYQWGRNADGHEKSDSNITTLKATNINNSGDLYINASEPYDWTTFDTSGNVRSTNWRKTDGTSICPIGFRVPSGVEMSNEVGESPDFNNFLKIPSAGSRYGGGIISGYFNWTSQSGGWVDGGYNGYMLLQHGSYKLGKVFRYRGAPVRCISHEIPNTPPTANAGLNQTTYKGNPITLDASNSSDSDGNITSYLWSEGNVTLSSDVNFTKYDFSVGVHIVTLQVTDDDNATAEVNVTVTINDYPEETLNANGTFLNTLDFLNSKRVYEFTLDEKTLVTIQASSQDMKVAGWMMDVGGTRLSRLSNWEAGEDGHFAYESILEAGTYTLEFFSQTAFASGDFSFIFDTKAYETIVQEPWSINIPTNVTYANNEIVSIDLDIQAQDGITLESKDLTIVSDNLPGGFEIIKIQDRYYTDQYSFKLEGMINSVDDFAITLNIADGDFSKEHKIYFAITDIIIDGIIGDGTGGKMVIKQDENNIIKPFKVAFNMRGVSEDDISSVVCKFSDTPILSKTIFEKTYYRENTVVYGKYICDIDSDAFTRGALSSEDFMNKLVAIDENERFLTIVVNFKDGTTVEKKILDNISVEKFGGYIRVREWTERTLSYSGGAGTIQIDKKDGSFLSYEYQDIIGKEFLVDYGDEVLLSNGRWTVVVGEHEFFVNTTFAECGGVAFKANEDLAKNEILLNLSYITVGENLELYAQRTGYSELEKSLKIARIASIGWSIWGKASNVDNCSQNDYFSDAVVAVRGTTFKMTLTDNGIDYDLYEGAIDINDSGIITELTTMQSYKSINGVVKSMYDFFVPSFIKNYFNQTSLYQADLNTTVTQVDINTNVDDSSYILIGNNVRFGDGKLNSFDNVTEGNYTLKFLPSLWNQKPDDINISLDANNTKEEITSTYEKIVDVLLNGISQDQKIDINISTTNIKIDQLEDESIYALTQIGDKNSSVRFRCLDSTINIDENGTTTTNLPLAKDVQIVMDKYGKVKPTINGAVLPKDDFPLGTKVEVIENTIRFIVPIDESIEF